MSESEELARARAECERLRAALRLAGESLLYFDVSRRTEAYLAVMKVLEA